MHAAAAAAAAAATYRSHNQTAAVQPALASDGWLVHKEHGSAVPGMPLAGVGCSAVLL